jgi:hypothetical protein
LLPDHANLIKILRRQDSLVRSRSGCNLPLHRASLYAHAAALAALLVARASAPCAASVLVGLIRDSSQQGYGGLLWAGMTARLNAAAGAGNIATTTANLNDLNQLLAYDGVWVDLRQFATGSLTATEVSNLSSYADSGRRLVLIGENSAYTTWSNSILNVVGSTYAGGNFSGNTPTSSFVPLTSGVSAVTAVNGGVAPGTDGLRLFTDRVVTVWGPARNVLVALDSNLFDDDRLALTGNSTFATNVASWITGGLSNGAAHWAGSINGSWTSSANWESNAMPSVADDAMFDLAPAGPAAAGYTVTVASAVAARNLLVPSQTLDLQVAGGVSLAIGQSIAVGMTPGNSGALTLSAGDNGAATVIAVDLSLGAQGSLSVASGLTLKVATANAAAGSSIAIAGTLAVQPVADSMNAPTICHIASVNFTGSGEFDLANNELFTNATLANVRSQLAAGAMYTSISGGGLGYKDAGGGSVEVRFTLPGDANLDGVVNVGDLGQLASNYGLAAGATWSQGDFNYDGGVGVGDLGALATNYGKNLATLSGAAGAQADVGQVPEPLAAPVVFAIIVAMRRTGRRRAHVRIPPQPLMLKFRSADIRS